MKNIYFLLLSFLLISCSYNQFYKDRESDKTDGEKFHKILLGTCYGKNPDDIYKLFGEKFFEVTDKEKLVKLMNTVNAIGPVEEYNLAKWENNGF